MTATLLRIAAQTSDVGTAAAERLGFGLPELIRSGLIVAIGFPLIFAASGWVRNAIGRRYSAQQGLIAGKGIFYPGVVILGVTILSELGFGVAPLLGAAGIIGIAVGFASQTSVSNVISGLFLIAERPFQIDDVIQVGSTVGTVLSIDTLSVKLRTFDNRYVRIPNETIVKSEVTTITRFPIRRLDLSVGVAYEEDLARVRRVLLEVAAGNPRALMEPAPSVFVERYGESALELRLAVWGTREGFGELRKSVLEQVKVRFEAEGIQIPFPHRTLRAGPGSEPFPVRVVSDADVPASRPRPDSGSPVPDVDPGSGSRGSDGPSPKADPGGNGG